MARKSLNKVMLIGNVGKDPEIRYLPGGNAVANFSLATNESYKNKEGKVEERTEWHKLVAFGKLAEICSEYVSKGKQIYIEGRIQTREWQDKEGQRRFTTEVIALNMILLGSKGESAASAAGGGGGGEEEVVYEPVTGSNEDIPF
jgi:single-strand DNA-binding protein